MSNHERLLKNLWSIFNNGVANKKETADFMKLSEATIDRLRKAGKLQSKKIGGQIFFKVEEIASFLDA